MSVEMEERVAYLERMVDELSAEVADRTTRVEMLERRVAMLLQREAAREADGGGGVVFGDERPPHY
jgi:SlyX protein